MPPVPPKKKLRFGRKIGSAARNQRWLNSLSQHELQIHKLLNIESVYRSRAASSDNNICLIENFNTKLQDLNFQICKNEDQLPSCASVAEPSSNLDFGMPKFAAERVREHRARKKILKAAVSQQNQSINESSTSVLWNQNVCVVNRELLSQSDQVDLREHNLSLFNNDHTISDEERVQDNRASFNKYTTKKNPPKTAAERNREYRARKNATKIKNPPKTAAERNREYRARISTMKTKNPPKTSAECNREYRARKKLQNNSQNLNRYNLIGGSLSLKDNVVPHLNNGEEIQHYSDCNEDRLNEEIDIKEEEIPLINTETKLVANIIKTEFIAYKQLQQIKQKLPDLNTLPSDVTHLNPIENVLVNSDFIQTIKTEIKEETPGYSGDSTYTDNEFEFIDVNKSFVSTAIYSVNSLNILDKNICSSTI